MTKVPTNLSASIQARLLKLAKERGDDFNLVLLRYFNERLLYRLSVSRYASNFVLKGAALFTVWGGHPHRPTKDLDFLGRGELDAERVRATFAEICRTDVSDDGVAFDADSIAVEQIREEARYEGLRVRLGVRMGSSRTQLQIDIGFGDAVVPSPEVVSFPTLLDMPPPKLPAYARETVVAEKLEAIVQLGMVNSRMKDFFDLWYMSRTFDFDGQRLAKALQATFERRGTELPVEVPASFIAAFAEDEAKAKQWAAFTRRLDGASTPPLPVIVDELRRFLAPVIEAARSSRALGGWPPGGPWGS